MARLGIRKMGGLNVWCGDSFGRDELILRELRRRYMNGIMRRAQAHSVRGQMMLNRRRTLEGALAASYAPQTLEGALAASYDADASLAAVLRRGLN